MSSGDASQRMELLITSSGPRIIFNVATTIIPSVVILVDGVMPRLEAMVPSF